MPGPIEALIQLLINTPQLPKPHNNGVNPVTGDLGYIAMDSDEMEQQIGATSFWNFAPGYRPGAIQRRELGQRMGDIRLGDIDLPSSSAPVKGLRTIKK